MFTASRRARAAVGGRSSLDRHSEIHVDFMVGSNDVSVTGITTDAREIPLLRGGAWQI